MRNYNDLLHQEYTAESLQREQLEDFYRNRAKNKGTGTVINELLETHESNSKRFKQQLAEKDAEIVELKDAIIEIRETLEDGDSEALGDLYIKLGRFIGDE